jgi:hypothetical protein
LRVKSRSSVRILEEDAEIATGRALIGMARAFEDYRRSGNRSFE